MEEKSAEEIARTAEKRKESGRRLQEITQKARLEKVLRSLLFSARRQKLKASDRSFARR